VAVTGVMIVETYGGKLLHNSTIAAIQKIEHQ